MSCRRKPMQAASGLMERRCNFEAQPGEERLTRRCSRLLRCCWGFRWASQDRREFLGAPCRRPEMTNTLPVTEDD